jgi:hypothetical protein
MNLEGGVDSFRGRSGFVQRAVQIFTLFSSVIIVFTESFNNLTFCKF